VAQATSGSASPYAPLSWWSLWSPQAWNPGLSAAPQSLTQPILPGWAVGNVITVTENNSSSPETERKIVAQESYGRQLGRLMDAVAVLIQERPEDLPKHTAFDDLLELSHSINAIKKRCAASRLKRVEADLSELKVERPDDYRRIASDMAREVEKISPR
jgi:hypothetical protein